MAATRLGRAATLPVLWRVLTSSMRPGAPGIAARAAAVPRLLGASLRGQYDGLSRGRVALVALALAYIVSPVDVVPEGLLLAVGMVDDVAVATWLAGALLIETEHFLAWERAHPGAGTSAAAGGGAAVVDGEVLAWR